MKYALRGLMGLCCCGLALMLGGCGYTTRSMVSNEYRSIYIAPFVNKIVISEELDVNAKYKVYRPQLESQVTDAVVRKFQTDGNLKAAKIENADLLLKGELLEFRRDPLRYTDSNDVSEYRLNIVVNLTLVNNRTQQSVWTESGFTGTTTYVTSGSFSKSEATAINDAIDDLARRVVERVVEQW